MAHEGQLGDGGEIALRRGGGPGDLDGDPAGADVHGEGLQLGEVGEGDRDRRVVVGGVDLGVAGDDADRGERDRLVPLGPDGGADTVAGDAPGGGGIVVDQVG